MKDTFKILIAAKMQIAFSVQSVSSDDSLAIMAILKIHGLRLRSCELLMSLQIKQAV